MWKRGLRDALLLFVREKKMFRKAIPDFMVRVGG